ncbi:transcriptional regulator [Vibrio ishigakensis]|uniref:Transcriptional regulator n=1 Tax=Vibrio ishigakensis TaxID=1481914 RepID=A0A0B8Q900_9VIBR|nr:transcriptional regulator [Vibrio ishigakensis]
MAKEPKRIQSIERGFSILEVLSLAEKPMSLQAISDAVEISKTTVHGILATLSALGYVSRVEQGYALGLRLRELSKPLEQNDESIRLHFSVLLKQMAQLTDNTAYLAVQSGAQEYLYIDAIERDNPLTIRSPRGKREGLTTSAIGKVFLAFDDGLRRALRLRGELSVGLERELNQVFEQGYALDLEEAEPNLNCLALPLYLDGKLVAVAGVSGSSEELNEKRLIHFAAVFQKR